MKTGGFKPKVVAIGGGTGLSTMLRGLKEYTPLRSRTTAAAADSSVMSLKCCPRGIFETVFLRCRKQSR